MLSMLSTVSPIILIVLTLPVPSSHLFDLSTYKDPPHRGKAIFTIDGETPQNTITLQRPRSYVVAYLRDLVPSLPPISASRGFDHIYRRSDSRDNILLGWVGKMSKPWRHNSRGHNSRSPGVTTPVEHDLPLLANLFFIRIRESVITRVPPRCYPVRMAAAIFSIFYQTSPPSSLRSLLFDQRIDWIITKAGLKNPAPAHKVKPHSIQDKTPGIPSSPSSGMYGKSK